MSNKFCLYCMAPVEDGKPCHACGLTQGSYTPAPHHLPPGTLLKDRYLVGRVLGEGGFGITYIGCDLQLELKVAIKEYFPTDKASRLSQASLDVSSYTGAAGAHYAEGLKKFLREARTIARMDKQPVIVNVRDFFETNHTAYIVMEYVEGTTFRELVEQRGGRIPAGELLYLIEPLFFALKEMHANGLIHRDISPENLMLEKGEVRLLDFGCAREAADGEATMTIALKHGYAPVEQYQSKGQGPWTDVYALSATIYYCLTGRKPPQAMDRLVEEALIPPRKLGVELTAQQEAALLRGMAVPPKRRFQTMEEFHTALYEGFSPNATLPSPTPVPASRAQFLHSPAPNPVPNPVPPRAPNPVLRWLRRSWRLIAIIASAAALVVLVTVMLVRLLGPEPSEKTGKVSDPNLPAGDIPNEPDPPAEPGPPAIVSSRNQLLEYLGNDTVSTIIIRQDVHFGVDIFVELTKPLIISAGSDVNFTRGLTVTGSGRVEVSGGLYSETLLRTADGGTVEVKSGGCLSSSIIWLERESDLTCAADGDVWFWGEENPTRDPIDDYARSHFQVLSETALFADAVHVGSEAEFIRHCQGTTPIIIDRDITFAEPHFCNVSVLIPEGVTVNAPAPMSGEPPAENRTLYMCRGACLFNYGTVKGRLQFEGFANDWNVPFLFVNYGTADAALNASMGTIVNLGAMTARETLTNVAVSNLGSLALDNQLEMNGDQSYNSGTLTVGSGASLLVYGGVWWHNYGQFTVETGGQVRNYSKICNLDGSTLAVHTGGSLENYGLLEMNYAAVLSTESGAKLQNDGVIEYAGDSLHLAEPTPEGCGRLVSYVRDSDWAATGGGVRFVETESEMRAALADSSCRLVIWNGFQDYNRINLNGGPLTVTKVLVLRSDSAHTANVNSGDITVSGENAFLIADYVDFHGNGLTVENGALAEVGCETRNLSRLSVSGSGLVFANSPTYLSGASVDLAGGALVNISDLYLDAGTLRVGENSFLNNYGLLKLTDCDTVNDGEFLSCYGSLYHERGTFANNGTAILKGLDGQIRLNCDVTNHGELRLGGQQEIGGVFTGNPVIYD